MEIDRTNENLEAAGAAVLTCLADIPDDPKLRSAAESAYRRGFSQGFFGAMEAMRAGNTYDEMEYFLVKKLLLGWRHKKHHGKHTTPPQMPKKEK